MPEPIKATVHNDPGCPWAYSAVAGHARDAVALRRSARLASRPHRADRERRPVRRARLHRAQHGRGLHQLSSLRYAVLDHPRARGSVAPGGRAASIAAARVLYPGREWEVFRALQLAWFTTQLLLDEDDAIRETIATVTGVDGGEIMAHITAPEVEEAYQRDRAEAPPPRPARPPSYRARRLSRTGRCATRRPSLIIERNGTRLEAGGFQPVGAYDVVVANIDTTLTREPSPETPEPLFERFPEGLTTQEVAVLLTQGNDDPDRGAAELVLLELAGRGRDTPRRCRRQRSLAAGDVVLPSHERFGYSPITDRPDFEWPGRQAARALCRRVYRALSATARTAWGCRTRRGFPIRTPTTGRGASTETASAAGGCSICFASATSRRRCWSTHRATTTAPELLAAYADAGAEFVRARTQQLRAPERAR